MNAWRTSGILPRNRGATRRGFVAMLGGGGWGAIATMTMRRDGGENGDGGGEVRATWAGLGAIVLWSTTVAVARRLSEAVGPITAGAAVYLVGGAVLLGVRRARGGGEFGARHGQGQGQGGGAGRWGYWLGCGGLFVGYTLLLFLALGQARGRERAVEVALINYLWPSLTVLFSTWWLRRRAKRGVLGLGLGVASAGLFMAMTQGTALTPASVWAHAREDPVPFGLALGAAVSWAAYSVLTRWWAPRLAGVRGAAGWFVLATGGVLGVIRLGVDEPWGWGLRAVGEALGLGTATALAYTGWEAAMRRGDLGVVTAASYFTPVLSTGVSCLYLGLVPGARLWWGCLGVVTGSLLCWWAGREGGGSVPERAGGGTRDGVG